MRRDAGRKDLLLGSYKHNGAKRGLILNIAAREWNDNIQGVRKVSSPNQGSPTHSGGLVLQHG